MPQPLLIATTNAGKLREIRAMLRQVPVDLVTLAAWPGVEAPEETGASFAENARLKAQFYAFATGLPTIAEDSGLEIDAMGGAPGVESARFGGVDRTYPEKFTIIYRRLDGIPQSQRTARFVCALAFVEGGVVRFEARGTVEGEVAPEPRGSGGFGYDPIFYYPPLGCTLAEAGDRKSEVSHRAAAFAQLKTHLLATDRQTDGR